MSELTIIEQCSPTLAGLKTANLFSCKYDCKKKLWEDIRCFNALLIHKGIRMIPLNAENNRALIYVFRPKKLESDISDRKSREILQKHGYDENRINSCIVKLIGRLKQNSEFPHEIGLFLGYPPEDVKAFIEHRDEGCKCVGCWKVYSDENAARKSFEKFKKCTRIYRKLYSGGKSIEQLTIAG